MIENIYQNHPTHFEEIHRGVPIPFDTSVIYTCQSRSFIAARIYRGLSLDILKYTIIQQAVDVLQENKSDPGILKLDIQFTIIWNHVE
jgi:hypothetical protein